MDTIVFYPSLEQAYTGLKNDGAGEVQAEAIIVDMGEDGFTITAQKLLRFSTLLKNTLSVKGICLLLAPDQALVFQNHEHSDQLAMEHYLPADSVFVTYPIVVETVRKSIACYSYLDEAFLAGSFKQQLLKNTVPVLRLLMDTDAQQNLTQNERQVLSLVDGKKTVEDIRVIAAQHSVPSLECDLILLGLERKRKVYPIFDRVEFLARCFQKRTSFRLGHYMVALRILSKPQLVDLLETQEIFAQRGDKMLLGQIMVKDRIVNEQALHLYLQDQALTAAMQNPGSQRSIESGATQGLGGAMIGHLETIEAQDLLQSLSGARKTGRLFLESARGIVSIDFLDGNVVHASLNRLSGSEALVEFLCFWKEGIFTFSTSKAVPSASASAEAKRPPLSKVLMDAAFVIDTNQAFINTLADGDETVLEKDNQFEARLEKLLADNNLRLADESLVSERDREEINKLTSRVDGINSVKDLANGCQSYPSYKAYLALQMLVAQRVLVPANNALTRALHDFQYEIQASTRDIGKANALKVLQITHRITFENKNLAGLFLFSPDLQLSLSTKDFSSQDFAISDLLLALKRWEETYKAYLARL